MVDCVCVCLSVVCVCILPMKRQWQLFAIRDYSCAVISTVISSIYLRFGAAISLFECRFTLIDKIYEYSRSFSMFDCSFMYPSILWWTTKLLSKFFCFRRNEVKIHIIIIKKQTTFNGKIQQRNLFIFVLWLNVSKPRLDCNRVMRWPHAI